MQSLIITVSCKKVFLLQLYAVLHVRIMEHAVNQIRVHAHQAGQDISVNQVIICTKLRVHVSTVTTSFLSDLS